MTFTVFRRRSRDHCESANRYEPRCGCPLHVQFVWKGVPGVFEGKKLAYQNKWSLETRSWSEAQSRANDLEKRLKDFAEGKQVPKVETVAAALQEWYEFRDQNGLGNTKAKQMGGKLVEWCEKKSILILTAFTTEKAIKWRLTLPHRTGDSSSLSVHWSIISGFFSWAAGMGYIEKSPIPNPKANPQFRIRYKKAEVKPPTNKQVEKILNTATGRVRLLCQLMRETAVALVDAMRYAMSQQDAEKSDAQRESQIERRLNDEFETPVHRFIDQLQYRTFVLSRAHIRKLTRYMVLLFHRSEAHVVPRRCR